MGYHPGVEDDGVYLAAVKAQLNPALFSHDAAFFQLQMRASVFDSWMAHFVRATGMSIMGVELLWQFIAIVLILWGCWSILCRLFDEAPARWGGIAAVSAMLTLPVAGTALYIADQYLHPRNLATALILLAVARVLARHPWQALPFLACACPLHPMIGAFGVSFCLVLLLMFNERVQDRIGAWQQKWVRRLAKAGTPVASLIPTGWVLRPPAPGWIEAMSTRHCFWLYQWTWYEWLGAIGPLILFWVLARWTRRRGKLPLARFATAVLLYGILQQAIAMILCGPRMLVVLSTLEPMRYLQLVYLFMVAIGGALLGQYVLKARILRWALFLLMANGSMFLVQRQLFAESPHIELPGQAPTNAWLQAFAWIRRCTPPNAYFALGSRYLVQPAEDMHNFRALAERSVLADDIKDRSVLSKAPELVPAWRRQVDAQGGWDRFQLVDFERLKADFGVDWVLLDHPPPAGLSCPWERQHIAVCRIP